MRNLWHIDRIRSNLFNVSVVKKTVGMSGLYFLTFRVLCILKVHSFFAQTIIFACYGLPLLPTTTKKDAHTKPGPHAILPLTNIKTNKIQQKQTQSLLTSNGVQIYEAGTSPNLEIVEWIWIAGWNCVRKTEDDVRSTVCSPRLATQ